MDRRRTSLEDSRHLRDANLHSSRALQRRCDEVAREEERSLRRTDREIESLRRELGDLKALATPPGPADAEFEPADDAYATPVVHEARHRVRNIRDKVARAEEDLRRGAEAAAGPPGPGPLCGAAPRLVVEEVVPPVTRAHRSKSVPNVPAHLERLTVEKMPGPSLAGLLGAAGPLGATGPLGAGLQVPGEGSQPLRKRSIDFSQLSSLGVIREND